MKYLNRKLLKRNIEYTGEFTVEKVHTQLFEYNSTVCNEKDSLLFDSTAEDVNTWVNLHGLSNQELISSISETFNFHRITKSDVVDVSQRPTFKIFDKYLFFSLKSILPDDEEILIEHISFVLGENFLISFQEKKADYFEHVRNRIRLHEGVVRERSVDYLFYLLLESILDNYSKTILEFDKELEGLKFLDSRAQISPDILVRLENKKRFFSIIQRTLIPIKEFLLKIDTEENQFIHEKHTKYFKSLYDLCATLIDESEHVEVRIDSNINLFFSLQSHKMNEIMKTLTVVSAIFIPLTFIAGIYGMNFNYIPELQWQWGYFAFWGLILIIFISLILYFRRRKWF